MRAWMLFVIDTGWFLVTLSVTVLAGVAIVATPIWLGLIHRELVAIHGDMVPCHCRHRDPDGPGPILPRVLPRVRRIGESAEQSDGDTVRCSGCGAEWHHMTPGPHKPIDKCPECPMSIEEFEALKAAARERAAK